MSSARFVLLSLCSALLLQAALSADPLFHFCSTPENFTASSPYESNLNKLTSFLYAKTPLLGFGLGSIGQYQDQVYGLSLCRGDASPSDCKACVADAGAEIRRRCPRNKGAIIWYDECMFKYLNTDFFSQIDNANKFYMWNLNNVSHPEAFNSKVRGLLTGLVEEAYTVPKLFATGKVGLEGKMNLYGLVQCTRDLSSTECKECLEGAIGELPSCCDGKEGGRVVGGSCNFRYEIYPFVNV
ncbi:cysteine-rich repeat secretory protein 38-like [Rhodamnia argentea]|uniref:Cysteine-rich repeat secretory protein 38-like n=1 Tax=Rhodamnia argentea TaxID=178133 RepID=A0A8B8QGT4_9MYRT|nr:cysteine-rich repeat secretory protein 38-like [Rhodamnia argentea]